MLLAQLVLKWAERLKPKPGETPLIVHSPAAALALADDLARLIDDMTTRQVPWEKLKTLVPENFDTYWQLTLEFLRIARRVLARAAAEKDKIDPAERRDRLIEAERQRLTLHDGAGDRGGLHRLDAGDRETARDHRGPAAGRGRAARSRHRPRRSLVEADRRKRERTTARVRSSSACHARAAARIGVARRCGGGSPTAMRASGSSPRRCGPPARPSAGRAARRGDARARAGTCRGDRGGERRGRGAGHRGRAARGGACRQHRRAGDAGPRARAPRQRRAAALEHRGG